MAAHKRLTTVKSCGTLSLRSDCVRMVAHPSINFFDRPALSQRKNNGRMRRDSGAFRFPIG